MTTQTLAEPQWQAPGLGLWEQDEAHQSRPYSRYSADLFSRYFEAGFKEGAEKYGLLIGGAEFRFIDGWAYMHMRMAGVPDKPGPLPPRWVFKLLFKLHPVLRGRTKTAAGAVRTFPWRTDAEWWMNTGRKPMLARLRSLQSIDLGSLSDEGLRAHLADTHATFAEGLRIHFRDALAHWIGVGDWLSHAAEWTGVPPEEGLLALQGSSPYSVDTLAYLDRVAEACRQSPTALAALKGPAAATERLQALRQASPAVADALDAYLGEHGWRIYAGFDVADSTIIEMPDNLLASIAARLEPGNSPAGDGTFARTLRSKVPQAHLAEYDALMETARIVYGVRDDDAGPTAHWSMGLVRRALLEAGDRLARKGAIERRDHIFDASMDEVPALLGATGTVVTATELASRARKRVESARVRPPRRFGEEEEPPPDDWLPSGIARINRALMTAMAVEMGSAPEEAETKGGARTTSLRGLAASRGVYEGRACVLDGPDGFENLQPGDILIAPFTTTAYNVVLPLLGGVVTDKGGVLSHAAIVAREYGIPAVVNTGNATLVIVNGSRVRIDGEAGTVEVIEQPTGVGHSPAASTR